MTETITSAEPHPDWQITIADLQGRAEALLMTIAGRRGVVGELSGPGRQKLADRTES
jgi:hypothetical protein